MTGDSVRLLQRCLCTAHPQAAVRDSRLLAEMTPAERQLAAHQTSRSAFVGELIESAVERR